MSDRPLDGKVAIVTGAGSPVGIGYAMASGLVRAGARVALTDINQKWLGQTINEVLETGGDDCAIAIVSEYWSDGFRTDSQQPVRDNGRLR